VEPSKETAEALDWLAANDEVQAIYIRNYIDVLTQEIADLERELADLKEGRTAIIPQSREHAKKLFGIYDTFWRGNANIVGFADQPEK
jgi:hypothetical protein